MGSLIALFLTVLVVGFGLGAMSMASIRPSRKVGEIDPKVVLDEIEEMTAG